MILPINEEKGKRKKIKVRETTMKSKLKKYGRKEEQRKVCIIPCLAASIFCGPIIIFKL